MLFALLATSPAAAQRAVLFDEDPSDPNGQRYVGSVTWHRNHQARLAIRRGRGTRRRRHSLAQIQNHAAAETQSRYIAAGEPRGRADVPFAARLCWWRHRQCTGNTDEIRRAGARDRTGRALRQGDGRFFYGRTVGYGYRARAQSAFVGMRAWFDIPIVYANQRRAIAAIEKGESGEQAFKAAFTAWGQYPVTVQAGLVVTAPVAVPVTPDGRSGTGVYVVQVASQRERSGRRGVRQGSAGQVPQRPGAWSPIITRADAGTSGTFLSGRRGAFRHCRRSLAVLRHLEGRRRTMRRAKELAALETLFERSAATPRVLDHEGLHWTELFLICSFYSANNQIMSQG
jgi:hypothetical protein